MEEGLTKTNEMYHSQYFGQALVHSYFTLPMLPWIVEEIILGRRISDVSFSLADDGVRVDRKFVMEIPSNESHNAMFSDVSHTAVTEDLIAFDDIGDLEHLATSHDDVNSNHLPSLVENLLHINYSEIIHAVEVDSKKMSHLLIIMRENKDMPIFCHAFGGMEKTTIASICSAVENRIMLENKKGISCNFRKLNGREGLGSCDDSDCVRFEVMLLGIVNIDNPNPSHTLIDDAVEEFNDKYARMEQQCGTVEKGIQPFPSSRGQLISATDFCTPGSPSSSYMDDSREGSLQMLQNMRQRCNSVEHHQRPTVRRRQRHSSEPSTYSNNLQRSRIRLFQLGRESIKMICPDKSTRTCEIEFSNISRCMQGIKNKEHFGIVADKVEYLLSRNNQKNGTETSNGDHRYSSNKKVVCYVFKCAEDYVCEEIMQGIKQAFATCVNSASPMREFDILCKDISGASSHEALAIAKLKMRHLNENEIKCVKAQLIEINPKNQEDKLAAVMAAMRQLYEVKHIEHMAEIKAAQTFVNQSAAVNIPVTKKLDSIRNKAMNSFGSLLQKGKKKMQELQLDAEHISEQLSDKSLTSPVQKFRFLSDSFSSSAPNTPQKDRYNKYSSLFSSSPLSNNSPRKLSMSSSRSSTSIRKRSTSLGSKPSSELLVNRFNEPPMLIYHKIFYTITNTGPLSSKQVSRTAPAYSNKIFMEKERSYDTPEDIRKAWKWAVRQNILLNKINSIQVTPSKTRLESSPTMQPDYADVLPVPNEMSDIWDELCSMPVEWKEKLDVRVLHAAVEKGIISSYRGRIWKLLRRHCHSNADESASSIESYSKMLQNLTPYQHAILIDIGRTFPSHPMYCQQLGPGQLSLFNVLKAYSLLDKEVGYCQGLSFIAGVLLMHTCIENEAYQLLYCLMHELGCRSMYLPDMKGMKLAIYKMTRLLHDLDEEMFNFFDTHEVSMMLVATPWFLTMFASTFPMFFVARIFDMIFVEGTSALFKVALCLLQEHKSRIIALDDFEDVVNYIRTEVPESSAQSLIAVITRAMSMKLESQLQDYEAEYRILQEEIPINRHAAETRKRLEEQIVCLESVNHKVTESNCDLLRQLHDAQQKVALLQRQLKDAAKNTKQSYYHT